MMSVVCVLTCSLYIYCCDPHPPEVDVVEPTQPTAAVIFLHGAGESGPESRKKVEQLLGGFSKYPNLRLVFPTAEARKFNPFPWNGQVTNVWYGLDKIRIDAVENVTQIDESASQIATWIRELVALGIPHKKICIAGFSSGALMSLHFGYEYIKDLGCIGSISGIIPKSSDLYKKLTTGKDQLGNNLPPVYLSAGKLDFFILPRWTEVTAEAFRSAGIEVTYNYQSTTSHFMSKATVKGLFDFIEKNILQNKYKL